MLVKEVCKKNRTELGKKVCKTSKKELGKKVCKKSSKEIGKKVCKKDSKELGKKVCKKNRKKLFVTSNHRNLMLTAECNDFWQNNYMYFFSNHGSPSVFMYSVVDMVPSNYTLHNQLHVLSTFRFVLHMCTYDHNPN